MATRKGSQLAADLYRLGGGKPWDTEETCSLIARHAVTYTRLEQEACSGPRWTWNYPGDWTARVDIAKFQAQNERDTERVGRRIAALVADLPATDHGPIVAELGGDPRGYTVRLLVPTAPGEVTEVGIDEEGGRVGCRRAVAS